MKFFKDKIKDFGTYLNGNGETVLYHKVRKSIWRFDEKDNSLKSYREEVK